MYKPSSRFLTNGDEAVNQFHRLNTRQGVTNGAGRYNGNRAQAFDAAGASGFTFLQAQLELIDTDIVKPLQAVTHARDMPVEVGGGFPEFVSAFATNYGSTGTRYFGLQGTNNTEITEAQADVQKTLWPTYNWTSGFTLTYIDLERLATAQRSGMPPPISLQDLYEQSVSTVYNKALDYVVYRGFLGGAGLINNPLVPNIIAPNGGSGTPWSTKTPTQILDDVNLALNQTVFNSGYDAEEGMADTMLVPYTQYALLTRPMTIGGIAGYQSTLDYILKNNVAAHHGIPFTIDFLPNDWITGQGLGSTDRAVVYKKSKKSLYLRITQPMTRAMTVPTTKDGGAYQTMFVACVSSVIFKRTTTQVYLDAI